ncbi:hypothetical protein BJ875DRAFT_368926 [Amylocarpus encephaloides]|uniref:DUF8021 domain-containing protein n=1 Tax=Amylocarpus encephaloides TaxID=45428 RepID=A0A9P7YQR6_9HELO|nr:hypothetical protein BJ875DRAFT_368926 [Amylocarpus encephaloides]
MLYRITALLALGTSASAACTRDSLHAATESLLAAFQAGTSTSIAALSVDAIYTENEKAGSITAGIFSKSLKIDHSRSSLDTTQCATYTEVIVTDKTHPYVIGTQMRFDSAGEKITKIETIVTDKGDWLFNAEGTLKYAKAEQSPTDLWGPIPEAKRDTRAVIQAAADAYLDLFNDKSIQVPWGTPCARLEGGSYTGSGKPTDSCNVGVPSGVKIGNRRYVIDETVGAVDVFCTFATSADTHEFRVDGGKLRFVHTMTNTGK